MMTFFGRRSMCPKFLLSFSTSAIELYTVIWSINGLYLCTTYCSFSYPRTRLIQIFVYLSKQARTYIKVERNSHDGLDAPRDVEQSGRVVRWNSIFLGRNTQLLFLLCACASPSSTCSNAIQRENPNFQCSITDARRASKHHHHRCR